MSGNEGRKEKRQNRQKSYQTLPLLRRLRGEPYRKSTIPVANNDTTAKRECSTILLQTTAQQPRTTSQHRPLAHFFFLFLNSFTCCCSYTGETAEKVLAAGDADAICFGRPFISNPDLPARFANGWPLAADAEYATWFFPDVPERTKYNSGWGYIDFPTHEAEQVKA